MRSFGGDYAAVPDDLDDDGIERLRDLLMLAHSARGWGLRPIAKLFGVSKPTVSRRLRAIPPEIVEHYLTTGFGDLL